MKFSIVSKDSKAPHVAAIVKAAQSRNLPVEVVNFHNTEELRQKTAKLGETVYWRASSLGIKSERAAAFNWLKNSYLINKALFTRPYVTHKFYQQMTIQAAGITGIETYKCRNQAEIKQAIKQGILKLPFIAKPDLGAHGIKVELVKTPKDLDQLSNLRDLVFQNYIKNKGDWRVIMLGGRALGVMKRTARPGSLLNNVFQGGQASQETDPAVLRATIDIASRAAAALGLVFCGVDIIYDETTSDYRLLEVNTAPEWLGGFQPVTGVNVADELVKFVVEIADRQKKPVVDLVKNYYQSSLDLPGLDPDDIFHFASRLYLWTGRPEYKKLITKIKGSYLGANLAQIDKKLDSCLGQEMPPSLIPARRDYFKKYPKLRPYNRMLFKVLFAEKVYGIDLHDAVKKLGIEDKMVELYHNLLKDKAAINTLSTHAVNFIFLLNNYSDQHPKSLKLDRTIDYQEYLLNEAQNRMAEMAASSLSSTELRLGIYMVSHVIIAASKFYQQSVDNPAFKVIVKSLEKVMADNYAEISLDLKLEFSICAKLCGCSSYLQPIIKSEAEESLSKTGNFLVDTYNKSAKTRPLKDRLWQSEHRSVLYIMTELPFQHENLRV